MTNNEMKILNLLGHKRNNNNIMQNNEFKKNEEGKIQENKPNTLTLKKPGLLYGIITEKNSENNFKEKNETKYINTNIKTENILQRKFCQRCNTGNNVLCFNNFKILIDYLSKNNILISKNFYSDENVNFNSPMIICSNCLLTISKNEAEFEKFFAPNKCKKINDNDDPFYNLSEHSNLKYHK